MFLLLLKISDFSLFFVCKNCNPSPSFPPCGKKLPPLFHQPPYKNWDPAGLSFWEFGRRLYSTLWSLKLCRQDFKNSWWSNGIIRFLSKLIYVVHNQLLQSNEIKSWIWNYEVLSSYVESECSSSK